MNTEPLTFLDVPSVVAALRAQDAPWHDARIVQIDEYSAALERDNGQVLRLVSGAIPHARMRNAAVESSVQALQRRGGVVLVLGGEPELGQLLERLARSMNTKKLALLQITEQASLRCWPTKWEQAQAIGRAVREATPLSADQRAELQAEAQAAETERQRFITAFRRTKPRVTYALAAAIAIAHLAQQSWTQATVIELGALSPARVSEGEWWRLVSTGFLHGGWSHALINGFVLVILGTQTERLLGHARFLLLYFVSLIGGSLASLQFLGDGVSVGASGAIWGLLAAHGALAWGRPPLLPPAIAARARKAAVTNLVLNVMISFVPGIDWAGHFGGGLAGGLLLASGLLTLRMSDLGDPPSPTRPLWPRALATVATLTMAGCAGYGLLHTTPWMPPAPVTVIEHQVGATGLSVGVPRGALLNETQDENQILLEYGRPRQDIAYGEVVFSGEELGGTEAQVIEALQGISKDWSKPKGAKTVRSPSVTTLGSTPALFATYQFQGEIRVQYLWLPTPTGSARIEAICMKAHHPSCPGPKEMAMPLARAWSNRFTPRPERTDEQDR